MRIINVHIYGFGKWVDKSFSFPQTGTIEIAGNNETGKTTLRQFILYILFGLPSKQTEQYLPKKGATVGGRIEMTGLADQHLTVERVYGKYKSQAIVYKENGEKKNEEWLNKKLQTIGRAQYQEIYTFDVQDLQKIQNLDNDALHEVLLAVGMTGTDRIYHAEKQLEKGRTELFKPYGKKPIINQLFQELKQIREQLSKAKEKENSYREQLEMMEQLENEIQLAEQEKLLLQQNLEETEKRVTHYSLMEDYYLTYSQLKRQATEMVFPSDGLARLKNYKDTLLPIQSEENILKNNLNQLNKEIENHTYLSDSDYHDLEQALHMNEKIKQISLEIEQYSKQINRINDDIQAKLKALQIDLTMNDLRDMDFPFYLEELWSDQAAQTDKLAIEIQYVENDLKSNKKLKETLQKDKQEYTEKMVDQDILHTYQKDIEQVKETEQYTKEQTQYNNWFKQFKKQLSYSNGMGMILLILSVILFLVTDLIWPVIVLSIAMLQNISIRLYGKAMKSWLQPDTIHKNTLQEEDIHEREKILQEQSSLKDMIKALDKELHQNQMEQLKLEERWSFLQERKRQVDQKVTDQQEKYPFLKSVELSYWPRVYQQLFTLKEKVVDCARMEEQLNMLQDKQRKKEEELAAFYSNDVNQIPQMIQQEDEKRMRYSQLLVRIKEVENQLTTNIEKQKPYQKEMNQLFEKATVDTEEAFIEKGEQYAFVQTLTQKYYQLYDSLLIVFNEEEIGKMAEGQFENVDTLQEHINGIKDRLKEINETYKLKQAKLSDQKANIALLEKNEDTSVLKHQLALKQSELQEIAKQWSIHQFASEALAKAKSNYSTKYMPQVFEQATSYFTRLTVGNYTQLYKNDEEHILVKDKHGFSYELRELSQATKDQLYIAIRFALSHVMANRLALPFLIDDGFVHFDANRKEKVLEILEEISEEHQVFYFTAHATEKTMIHLS